MDPITITIISFFSTICLVVYSPKIMIKYKTFKNRFKLNKTRDSIYDQIIDTYSLKEANGTYKGFIDKIPVSIKKKDQRMIFFEFPYIMPFYYKIFIEINSFSAGMDINDYTNDIYFAALPISHYMDPGILIAVLYNIAFKADIKALSTYTEHFSFSEGFCTLHIDIETLKEKTTIYQIIKPAISMITKMENKKFYKKRIKEILTENYQLNTKKEIFQIIEPFKDNREIKNIIKKTFINGNPDIAIEAALYMGTKGNDYLKDVFLSAESTDIQKDRALELLAKNKSKDFLDFLISAYKQFHTFSFKTTILDHLFYIKSRDISDFLINLYKDNEPGYSSYIINALKRCGSIKTVEKLSQVQQKSMNPIEKLTINNVIKDIQSRFDLGDKGWVSLPETDLHDGDLSIDDQPKGNISIIKK